MENSFADRQHAINVMESVVQQAIRELTAPPKFGVAAETADAIEKLHLKGEIITRLETAVDNALAQFG